MIFKRLFLVLVFILKFVYSNQVSDDDPTKLGPCTARLVDGGIIDLSK